MSNALDLLAQYAGAAPQPASASSYLPSTANVALTAEQKKADVANAADQKMAMMNQGQNTSQNYQTALAGQTGVGLSAMDERQRDAATMDPLSLYAKYGNQASQMMADRAAGARALRQDQSQPPRSGSQVAADTVTGIGLGLANSVGGLAALGAGLTLPMTGAGPAMAKSLQDLNEFGQSTQSPQMKAARNISENLSALQTPVREAQQQADKAAGDSGFMAGLKRVGRDALDSAGRLADSPELVGDIAAQGVGSILTAGPLSRGLAAAGSAVVPKATQAGIQAAAAIDASMGTWSAARVANFIGAKWTMPAAIGLQEGGGAYQSNAGDIQGASFADLKKNSPMFNELVAGGATQEEARSVVANRAGLLAAAIQTPLAAATGVIASKFEAHPFSVPSLREAGRNVLKEGAEETLQSVTGQLSQNKAKQLTSNVNQNLAEGVGDQAVQGLVGGLGSAGLTQAPGVGAQLAGKAATVGKAATIAATKPLVAGTSALTNWLAARGDKKIAAAQEQSPVSDTNVSQAAATVAQEVPVQADLAKADIQAAPELSPEQKQAAQEHVDALAGAFQFDPASVAGSDVLSRATDGASNQVDALQKMSQFVNDTKNSEEERAHVGAILNQTLNGISEFVQTNPKALEGLPADHPAVQMAHGVADVIASLNESPAIQRAQRTAETLTEKVADNLKPVTDGQAGTTLGDANINNHIAVAENAPLKASPDDVATILKQNKDGKLNLSDAQINALRTAAALLNGAKVQDEETARLGLKPEDVVGKQIKTDDGRGPGQYSALQHARIIRDAVRAGDIEGASAQLADFSKFVQHMQNKVGAINEHLDTAVPGVNSTVHYEALSSSADRGWVKSRNGMFVNTNNERSVALAQRVGVEAQTLTDIHNSLVDAFPQLGGKHMAQAPLNARLTAGNAKQVVESFKSGVQQEAAPVKEETISPKDTKTTVARKSEASDSQQDVTPATTSETAPKVVEQASEVTSDPTETDPAAPKDSIQHVYPGLVVPQGGNKFVEAFRLPKEAKSTTIGTEAPIDTVRADLKAKLPKEVAKEFGRLLDDAGLVVDQLNTQLANFLKKNKVGARFMQGEDVHTWADGKLLNLVEENGGKLTYNPEIIQNSALAAMHWFANSNLYGQIVDRSDVAQMLGMKEADVSDELFNQMSAGMSALEATQSLAQLLPTFWGLQTNNAAPDGYTKGIPLSMAAELLSAMEATGHIEVNTINLSVDGGPKDFVRITVNSIDKENAINQMPSAIADSVGVKTERPVYINTEVPVAKTQMRNQAVQNTAQDTKAIKANQETPYYADSNVYRLYESLGDRLMEMFAAGDIRNTPLNVNHRATLDGQNITTMGALVQLDQTMAEVRRYAEENGIPEDQVPVNYAFNMSRVGRLQQLGKYGPQAAKTAREVLLPNRATLDLTDDADRHAFDLGLAQALGVKIHNMQREAMENKLAAELAKNAPAIEELRKFLNNQDFSADVLIDAVKGQAPVYLHALLEHARSLETNDPQAFVTTKYMEADGMTNGPINAMGLLSRGSFTQGQIDNLAKGGFFFGGTEDQNSQVYRSTVDSKDLYQATTDVLKGNLADLAQTLQGEGSVFNSHFSTLMDMFMSDYDIKDGKLELSRGIAKNPLTITVYGSGAEGIAAKMVEALHTNIYEAMSEALQAQANDSKLSMAEAMFGEGGEAKWAAFNDAVNYLSENTLQQGKKGWYGKKEASEHNPITNFETFTFGKNQKANMTKNMRKLFVDPLRAAINTTVGDSVMGSAEMVRKATQAQSIVLGELFKQAINTKLDEVVAAGRKKTEFLSQNEQAEVLKSLDKYAPMIDSNGQRFFISGSQNSEVQSSVLGKGLDDRFRTPGFVYGPADSGVAGIPFLNIGMGDGKMIQNMYNDPKMPKGTLPIFDGVHFPLDQIRQGSEVANKAVYDSWQGNPLKAVYDSFSKFMDNMTPDMIVEGSDMYNQLNQALNGLGTKETPSPEMLHAQLTLLQNELDSGWKDAEARHKAIDRLNISMDQMAGAGAPYRVTSKESLVGTAEQKLARLNEIYAEERAKLDSKKEAAAPVEKMDLSNLGREDKSGVRVLSYTALGQLAKSNNLDTIQTNLLREIQRSEAAKGYKVLVGTPEQIRAYSPELAAKLDQNTAGFTDTANKVIVSTEGTAENLLHEMVHAATFDKVQSHYNGQSSPVVSQAIGNLETLMDQFRGMEESFSTDAKTYESFRNAQASIEAALNNPAYDVNTRKAAGLNEFMAWGLSNKELAAVTGKTEAKSLVAVAKAAIAAIKQLVWGRKALPEPKPGTDMFSHLLFNSAILMNSEPTLNSQAAQSTLFQSRVFGTDDRLTEVRNTFTRKITDYVKNAPLQVVAKGNVREAVAKAVAVSNEVEAVFPMTMQEAGTFRRIVAAMATEANFDPSVMAKAQEYFAHVAKNLTVEHFLDNPEDSQHTNLFTPANAKFNALLGRTVGQTDASGRSTNLSVFMGLALTNPDARKALAKIGMPGSKKSDATRSPDRLIENIGYGVMDALSRRLTGTKDARTVPAAMDALHDRLMDITQDENSFIQNSSDKAHSFLDNANDRLVEMISEYSEAGIDKLGQLESQSNSNLAKTVYKVGRLTLGLATEQRGKILAEGLNAHLNTTKLHDGLRSIMNDLVGRTESNSSVIDLIKLVKSNIQATRQIYREQVPNIIASKFTRELSEGEWKTLHEGMAKTDIASLLDGNSVEDVRKLLGSQAEIDARINNLEASIQAHDPVNWGAKQAKMQQLAKFMVTGEAGHNLLRNAYAISKMFGEKTKNLKVSDRAAQREIDHLVTLYALDQQSASAKTDLASLVGSESDGMDFSLNYLKGLRKDESIRVAETSAALINHYKGWSPENGQQGLSLQVAPDSEHTKWAEMSHKRIGSYKGSSADVVQKKGYYFAPVQGRAAFDQGLFQNVRSTASGVDAVTGYSTQLLAGRITDRNEVAAITRGYANEGQTKEPLLPVYSENGTVVAYERSIDPEMMSKLNPERNLAKSMGQWAGRQVEEVRAKAYNEALIGKLADMYEADIKADSRNENQYEDVFSSKDPVLRDAAKLISGEMRTLIADRFPDGFKVRRDMLNDALGYRQASVGDAWTGNSRWSQETQDTVKRALIGAIGLDAYKVFTNAEKFVKNVVGEAKSTIVVKSVIVPVANVMSNILQLVGRGVPFKTAIGAIPAKTNEINEYVKGRTRIVEAEAELVAATDRNQRTKLQAEIQSINDSFKRMSIAPLIEAGEFSGISHATDMMPDDVKLASGKWRSYVEGLVDRLPEGAKTVGKYAIVSKDTALYTGLQKMVEYGDFLGKAILFDHLTQKKGWSKEKALGQISEEFVNYDRLPGRNRGYLEQMGLLWFMNFKLRSTKQAVSMIRNNPVHTLLASLVPVPHVFGGVGLPTGDNFFSKMANGTLGYAVGPGQLFHAPMLNPWASVIN
ncbi:virion DNA-directed RNA polymerase [Burkholderia phage vB_BpP_HN05]